MTISTQLRELYNEGRLLPFLGAGVSASVTWKENGIEKQGPSWRKLVDQAAFQLGFSEADLLRVRGTDLQILEYYKIKFGGHTKLINWLLINMKPPDDALLRANIYNQLVQMINCRTIYTTNFDDFIERSFGLHKRLCHTVATEGQLKSDPKSAEIIKFHGDWDNPTLMVLTESDFERRMTQKEPMDHKLWSDLLNKSILFIGYSFRDPNVAYLFWLIKDQLKGLPNTSNGRRGYIILHEPSAFERKLFEERNIEIIPIYGNDKAASISEILEEIRS